MDFNMHRRHSRAKVLEPALFSISLNIRCPNRELVLQCRQQFEYYFSKLLELMMEDKNFDALFTKRSYQGSIYERTKIVLPDEYDVDLEFGLLKYFDMKIDTRCTCPGHARVKLNEKKQVPNRCVLNLIKDNWITRNWYLRMDKVLDWLKSVIKRAVNKLGDNNVIQKEGGQAITLYFTKRRRFSVDFVPTLLFKTENLPRKQFNLLMSVCQKKDRPVMKSDLGWQLVPKRPRNKRGQLIKDTTQWRMSFYLYEKRLLHDLCHTKPVYRLLKWFRDRQKWNKLSSYYIKTLFLLEMQKMGPAYFRKTGLGELFLHMLESLRKQLSEKKIPFFWNRKLNLIKQLPDEYVKTAYNRLDYFKCCLDEALSDDEGDSMDILEKMFKVTLYEEPRRNPVIGVHIEDLYEDLSYS